MNLSVVIWCDLLCLVKIHLVVSFISSSPNMCVFWHGLVSCPFLLVPYLLIIPVVCTEIVIMLNNENGRPCIMAILFCSFCTRFTVLDNKSNIVMINCSNSDKWAENFFFYSQETKKLRCSPAILRVLWNIFHYLIQNCDPLTPKLTHLNKAAF
jgi:hypothetical protein